jgi:shikimate 5-dehydrogenase
MADKDLHITILGSGGAAMAAALKATENGASAFTLVPGWSASKPVREG